MYIMGKKMSKMENDPPPTYGIFHIFCRVFFKASLNEDKRRWRLHGDMEERRMIMLSNNPHGIGWTTGSGI